MNVVDHHLAFDCLTQDDELTKEIRERLAKWERIKAERKKQRRFCPYGCGKNWGNIHTISVKRHILFKCKKINGQTKVQEFYKKRKRMSFSDVVA